MYCRKNLLLEITFLLNITCKHEICKYFYYTCTLYLLVSMCPVIGQFLGPYILLFGPLKFKAVLLPYFSLIYRQTFLTFIASKSLFNFLLLSYSVLKHANYLAAISNWHVLLSIYVRNLKPISSWIAPVKHTVDRAWIIIIWVFTCALGQSMHQVTLGEIWITPSSL